MKDQKITWKSFKELARNSWRAQQIAWREHTGLLVGLLIVSLLTAIVPFLRSGSVALLLNTLQSSSSSVIDQHLLLLIIGVILATVLPGFFSAFYSYFDKQAFINLLETFDLLYIKKKGEIDVAAYEDPKFNDLLNTADERGSQPLAQLSDAQFQNLLNVIQLVIASAILLSADWVVFVAVFLGFLPQFYVEAKYGQATWGIFSANASLRRLYFDRRHHFYDLANLTELKLFQNTSRFFSVVKKLLHEFNEEQKHNERKKLLLALAALTISMTTVAFAIYTIVAQVVSGLILIGTMTFLLASIGDLRSALSGFFFNIARQYEWSHFATDIFKVLDVQPVIKNAPDAHVLDLKSGPEIVFENISFKYPYSDAWVLKDFNLTIKAGEKIALVGINGAGKTTFVKLLARFYDPIEGRILINSIDLRDIDRESWYKHLAILFQDYASYHFPVKEAIALGRSNNESDEINMLQVERAAQLSESVEFIKKWEKQYEQMLGKQFEGGISPSRGQLQKLAIARSIFRDPQVLVLDEPTAAVDAIAEMKIFEQLNQISENKTLILISHRFSTVRKADRIAVIEDGALAELGTHHELIQENGLYAEMFNNQAKDYVG
jgi:ATP-binding cassette subfamily B protein